MAEGVKARALDVRVVVCLRRERRDIFEVGVYIVFFVFVFFLCG